MDNAYIYGPKVTTVLSRQMYHRSEDVLNGDVDSTLSLKRADGSFWRLNNERRLHPRVIDMLCDMRFYGVYKCGQMEIDYHLITALVERWRPETHTFHFRVGEVTVTLQDIAVIWGLPIDGRPIIGCDTRRTIVQLQDYCEHYLGFRPLAHQFRGSRLSLPALADYLRANPVDDDTTYDDLIRYTRGCALMLLGGLMCPDSSSVAVSVLYLQHMEDIQDVCTFSWGSAVLAFLYRELCTASQRGKHVIGGAMQLLQIWAWSRIKTLVPKSLRSRIHTGPVNDDNELPRPPYGARWAKHNSFKQTARHSVRIIRDILDRMTPNQFIWQPYDTSLPEITMLPPSCNTPVWRSKCPLINYAIVEMHRPERVMRQFGLQQYIPPQPPLHEATLHDINRRGRLGQDWAHFHREYVSQWENRYQFIVSGPVITGSNSIEPGYMAWYNEITRRLISPSHLVMHEGYQPSDTAAWDAMGLAVESLRLCAEEANEDDHDSLVSFRNQALEITEDLMRLYRRQQSAVHLPGQQLVPHTGNGESSSTTSSSRSNLNLNYNTYDIDMTQHQSNGTHVVKGG